MTRSKIKALADFMNITPRAIVALDTSVGEFAGYDHEFLVLTEKEANDQARAAALMRLVDLPVTDVLPFMKEGTSIGEVEVMQNNGLIFPLIELLTNQDKFVKHIMDKVGGRGGLIAVDSEENSENEFYIYRTN